MSETPRRYSAEEIRTFVRSTWLVPPIAEYLEQAAEDASRLEQIKKWTETLRPRDSCDAYTLHGWIEAQLAVNAILLSSSAGRREDKT